MSGYISYGKNLDREYLITVLNTPRIGILEHYLKKYFEAIVPEFNKMILAYHAIRG